MPRRPLAISALLVAQLMTLALPFPGDAEAAPKCRGLKCADTTAPAVSVTAPAAGSAVSGTVSVSGSAADSGSSVARVEVRVDSGPWTSASGTTSWTWSWATSGLLDGTHILTARATDAAGNTATTDRKSVV